MSNRFRIAFIVMYSEKFAMTGETHGVSVLAGVITEKYDLSDNSILILDMYGGSIHNKTNYIINQLQRFQPDIIAFSCPYGSYTVLKHNYKCIRKTISPKSLVVFGGALPTYIPEKYIEIDRKAFVVIGEGEEALYGLVDCYIRNDFSEVNYIPNLCYYNNYNLCFTGRKLVNLSEVPPPYRNHLGISISIDSQIYVEHSRGCTWSSCSFCSRNLLSLDNCPKRYRVFSKERLLQDLSKLKSLGINAVTFADEDFAGSGLKEKYDLLDIFMQINSDAVYIMFDVSMNVNSIYSDKWNSEILRQNCRLLKRMKQFGLRKVFLGVESGSSTQLKRYRKQQSVSESIAAIRILEECNLEIEIGFIVFDPLCTMNEVLDDLNFLSVNNFAKYVSSLGSGLDLRLHMDTPYVRELIEFENYHGVTLHSESYDLDTLNYSSCYFHDDVSRMASLVKQLNAFIRPIYYPLKSISRYGLNGSLQHDVQCIKDMVVKIRNTYLMYLIELAENITDDDKIVHITDTVSYFMIEFINENIGILSDIHLRTNNSVLGDLLVTFSNSLT